MEAPAFEIRTTSDLTALLGYLSTWSATRHAREAGRTDILERFTTEITELWSDPSVQRSVRWPISLRIARVAQAR